MKELVSIITPVYNASAYLEAAIISVIDQSYEDWELILIDDCSSDNSKSIIQKFANRDSRILPIFLKKNKGAGYTRNIGLKNSKGDYIAFLDSDDYWQSNKLREQIDFIKNNGVEIVSSFYYNIDEFDHIKSYFVLPSEISYNLLKYNNYILTSTLLCKAKSIANIEFSTIRKRQDWIFFLDILKPGLKAYTVKKCLTYYRKSDNSLSANKLSLVKSNLSVISNYFYNGNVIKSLIHFFIFLIFYFHNKIFNRKRIKN